MRITILIVLAWLGHTASVHAGEASVRLKPCYNFEVDSEATFGKERKAGRESFFTEAELPWVPLGVTLHTQLEEGFVAKEEKATVEVDGKMVSGRKITYVRDPKKGPANLHVAQVRLWVTEAIHSPTFEVRLGQSHLHFFVPPGCVKMEVVPHEKESKGIGEFELANTGGATGALTKTVRFKIGDKELTAHQFVCTVPSGKFKGKWTYTVSKEIPGNVCSIEADGDFKGIMRVAKMTEAERPKGLDVFAKEGFAFAPPPGYKKSPTLAKDEIVRYVHENKEFISVSRVALDKSGLAGLENSMPRTGNKGKEPSIQYSGNSRSHHLAGHRTFDASDENRVTYIFAQHGERGYRLAVSNLRELRQKEAAQLLSSWRWVEIDPKK